MNIVDRNIKTSTYRINRLVNGDNTHVEMRNLHDDPFEVLEGTVLLVKLHTIGRLSPTVVKIDYGTD
jgi:hypothetical protein